jgi:aspartyl-tRNA(Asn)/glutamyl-tRNA(Gln) amidotransferase subunit C
MVTRDQVLHVARLAKLALSPQEEERLVRELGRILEHADRLAEIRETAGERTHVAEVSTPPRADEPRPGLPREEVTALFPRSDGETLHVPAVIDGGGAA